MHTAKLIDPIAALLDAQTDAHHAGVCDAEVAVLADIGEDIARCAELIGGKLAGLTDGRMFTNWNGHVESRKAAIVSVSDLAECMAADAIGGLDAAPVILASMRLYLGRRPAMAKAA